MGPAEKRAMFGPSWMQRLQAANAPANDVAWNWARQEQTPYQRFMRRALNYRGDGDYLKGGFAQPNSAAALAIRALGGAASTYYGYGPAVGTALGGVASKWAGFGDYKQAAPVTNQIMGGHGGGVTVNASDDLTGDIYLSHKEYVGNVTATSAAAGASPFQQKIYELNPGLQETFPFLAQLATNFELYDFQGLLFEYRPTSGEMASTNSLGKVIMATQYDNDAGPFLNSVQMQNYDYSTSCKPSVSQIHGVETANRQSPVNMMYVRNRSSSRDKTFTDTGKFIIATEGIPFAAAGTQILGELWVTYRIKLSRATLFSSLLGLNQPIDYLQWTSLAGQWCPGTSVLTSPQDPRVKTISANAGNWTIRSFGISSARTFAVVANPSISVGCYQWTLFADEPTPATAQASIAYASGVGNSNGVTFLLQGDSPTTSSQIVAGMKGAGERSICATGLISVNITPGTGVAFFGIQVTNNWPAGIWSSLLISQVPCTLAEVSLAPQP